MLPEAAVKEFKEIYRKRYGRELSDEEAKVAAEHFFGLYCAVYDPPAPGEIKNEENYGEE